MADDHPTKRHCHGTAADGGPCRATPLRPGTVIEGVGASGRYCRAHDPEIPGSTQLTSADRVRGGEATRKTKPIEIERMVMERHAAAWMRPYWRALGYELDFDRDGEPGLTERPEGGAKLYATAVRDGIVVMSEHEDLAAQISAAEKLRDRVYGRPTQMAKFAGSVEHRGAGQLDIAIEKELDQMRTRFFAEAAASQAEAEAELAPEASEPVGPAPPVEGPKVEREPPEPVEAAPEVVEPEPEARPPERRAWLDRAFEDAGWE